MTDLILTERDLARAANGGRRPLTAEGERAKALRAAPFTAEAERLRTQLAERQALRQAEAARDAEALKAALSELRVQERQALYAVAYEVLPPDDQALIAGLHMPRAHDTGRDWAQSHADVAHHIHGIHEAAKARGLHTRTPHLMAYALAASYASECGKVRIPRELSAAVGLTTKRPSAEGTFRRHADAVTDAALSLAPDLQQHILAYQVDLHSGAVLAGGVILPAEAIPYLAFAFLLKDRGSYLFGERQHVSGDEPTTEERARAWGRAFDPQGVLLAQAQAQRSN